MSRTTPLFSDSGDTPSLPELVTEDVAKVGFELDAAIGELRVLDVAVVAVSVVAVAVAVAASVVDDDEDTESGDN